MAAAETVKIAGVQMDVLFGAAPENLRRMFEFLAEAVSRGARLVIFPECAVSGYCCENYPEACTLADPIPGPITDQVKAEAQRHGCYVIFGMLEQAGASVHNACVLVGPEGVLGRIPQDASPQPWR